MREETVTADVLVAGGGIAGLMAAIRAAELGADVVVAEKANTVRSGAAAVGNDHFSAYIPEVHGPDVEVALASLSGQSRRNLTDKARALALFNKSFDIVKLWDSWGIPMKYEGKYEFAGHRLPGSQFGTQMKYSGRMQKPILTREAVKRGAKIMNRTMVFDLLGDENGVAGALAFSTREDRFIRFLAKSVILSTGSLKRMFPGLIPGLLNNSNRPLSTAGDGRAMAYRIGAELQGMETVERHAGIKNFIRDGQGSWIGVYRDPRDKPIGPFMTKPDRRYNDMIAEVNKDIFNEYAKSGKGPVYMDLRGVSEEDLAYFKYFLSHEGGDAILNHLEEEGIDLRTMPIEFTTYENNCWGGVNTNIKSETNVKGLYAAGDETAGGIARAAIFGWFAGENAVDYNKSVSVREMAGDKIAETKGLLEDILKRENGPGWREVNIALQHTMLDYAGPARTANYLEAGLAHLGRLKTKARNSIMAINQHELSRAVETLNLLDVAETIFTAAIERKETRGLHVRLDYPYTNPMMDKTLLIKRQNGIPVAVWQSR